MKKMIFLVAFSLMSASAMADGPSVKITSFNYARESRSVAELCGVVSNATTTPTFIQLTVDESSKRPAIYNTIAGNDGKFCATVVTYYGTASAKAF